MKSKKSIIVLLILFLIRSVLAFIDLTSVPQFQEFQKILWSNALDNPNPNWKRGIRLDLVGNFICASMGLAWSYGIDWSSKGEIYLTCVGKSILCALLSILYFYFKFQTLPDFKRISGIEHDSFAVDSASLFHREFHRGTLSDLPDRSVEVGYVFNFLSEVDCCLFHAGLTAHHSWGECYGQRQHFESQKGIFAVTWLGCKWILGSLGLARIVDVVMPLSWLRLQDMNFTRGLRPTCQEAGWMDLV